MPENIIDLEKNIDNERNMGGNNLNPEEP